MQGINIGCFNSVLMFSSVWLGFNIQDMEHVLEITFSRQHFNLDGNFKDRENKMTVASLWKYLSVAAITPFAVTYYCIISKCADISTSIICHNSYNYVLL